MGLCITKFYRLRELLRSRARGSRKWQLKAAARQGAGQKRCGGSMTLYVAEEKACILCPRRAASIRSLLNGHSNSAHVRQNYYLIYVTRLFWFQISLFVCWRWRQFPAHRNLLKRVLSLFTPILSKNVLHYWKHIKILFSSLSFNNKIDIVKYGRPTPNFQI